MSGFEATDAFKLFANIIEHSGESPLRNLGDDDVRSLLREQARRLIRAFVEMQLETRLPEIVLQPRISFRLPPLVDRSSRSILTDAIAVSGYNSSLKDIFAIAGTETTWGGIKSRVKEADGNDPLWVTDIEEASFNVAQDFIPEQPDGLCHSVTDGKFYRVLFARYEPYKSGARSCYILFIPSRPRQFDLKKRSSLLLSALILSIRFRQRIIPFAEAIRSAQPSEKAGSLLSFERTLHQVETEAVEFGLSKPTAEEDEHPLLQVIRSGTDKDFMADCIKSWEKGRGTIATAITRIRTSNSDTDRTKAATDAEGVVVGELEKVIKVNGRFIELLTEELLFTEKVGLDEHP